MPQRRWMEKAREIIKSFCEGITELWKQGLDDPKWLRWKNFLRWADGVQWFSLGLAGGKEKLAQLSVIVQGWCDKLETREAEEAQRTFLTGHGLRASTVRS